MFLEETWPHVLSFHWSYVRKKVHRFSSRLFFLRIENNGSTLIERDLDVFCALVSLSWWRISKKIGNDARIMEFKEAIIVCNVKPALEEVASSKSLNTQTKHPSSCLTFCANTAVGCVPAVGRTKLSSTQVVRRLGFNRLTTCPKCLLYRALIMQ